MSNAMPMPREEYIEQEYFFRVYRERLQENMASQDILKTVHEEILSTTRLPMAVDFMRAEILHTGRISDAMARLSHYFTPFQTFVVARAEEVVSRFDQITALEILEREARYRASMRPWPVSLFTSLNALPAIASDTTTGWRPCLAIPASTTSGKSGS